MSETKKCGYVAIVGRPNVGKSTLLNRILGQKISITSKKPQTTRHQILGVRTDQSTQAIYVDTPGIHRDQQKEINRMMNRAASDALVGVDLILMMVERTRWKPEDDWVLEKVKRSDAPAILLINKVDKQQDKEALLPFIEEVNAKHSFDHIVPVSAKQGHNVEQINETVASYMPESDHHFDEDQVTNRSVRFLCAEMVREKLMRRLGEELPYALTVEIEEFRYDEKHTAHVSALILVETDGQKKIVIGQSGQQLKQVGQDARVDIQKMLDTKVMLRLWVKVKSGWADDSRALRSLGYD